MGFFHSMWLLILLDVKGCVIALPKMNLSRYIYFEALVKYISRQAKD